VSSGEFEIESSPGNGTTLYVKVLAIRETRTGHKEEVHNDKNK
jgi:hypothetical protein